MAAQNIVFKSISSLFALARTERAGRAESQKSVQIAPADGQDEEQLFLASIAHLPSDEQQKRIQKREMYRRMALRQDIMGVESQSNLYYRS